MNKEKRDRYRNSTYKELVEMNLKQTTEKNLLDLDHIMDNKRQEETSKVTDPEMVPQFAQNMKAYAAVKVNSFISQP